MQAGAAKPSASHLLIYIYTYIYICITYILVYLYITCIYIPYISTDRVGAPRPRPKNFSKLVLRTCFCQACICISWLSGALVGVAGSDFIG